MGETTVNLETGDILAQGTEHGAAVVVPFTLSQYVSYNDPWRIGGYSITLAFIVCPVV